MGKQNRQGDIMEIDYLKPIEDKIKKEYSQLSPAKIEEIIEKADEEVREKEE